MGVAFDLKRYYHVFVVNIGAAGRSARGEEGSVLMLSGTAEYALRAVVHLARTGATEPVRAEDLAAAIDVPRNYLGKILNELVRAGILHSARGKHGGFRLARPADQVPLLDIVSLFDRVQGQRRCLLGRPECSDRSPCPAHRRWKATAERIARFFSETTVADVLD
jgi:Rrf2 family protein